ncbi:MAG: hypothetical protein GWP70_10620 [Proteobacteria bacterium]|nr:hypothetical protein [Pseudomonadota bacterium]
MAANVSDVRLSERELARYREQGFLLKKALFSEGECEAFRLAAQRVETKVAAALNGEHLASEPAPVVQEYRLDGNRFVDLAHITVQFEHGDAEQRLRVVEPVNDLEPLFEQLLDEPRLCQPMKQLIPADQLALWTAKLNFKHSQVGSGFGWHQDAPYWVHDSDHVEKLPNVMVLFDDASAENGCFRVIEGSHRNGCLPGCDDQRQLAGFYTHPQAFDEGAQVLLDAPAGSAVFFDPHVVHGSGPNHSALPRRAIIITYQPAGFVALKSKVERLID